MATTVWETIIIVRLALVFKASRSQQPDVHLWAWPYPRRALDLPPITPKGSLTQNLYCLVVWGHGGTFSVGGGDM